MNISLVVSKGALSYEGLVQAHCADTVRRTVVEKVHDRLSTWHSKCCKGSSVMP